MSFKAKVTDFRQKLRDLMGESHISKDAASAMEECLTILAEYDRLLQNSGGQSGEVRIQKARVEKLQGDLMKKDTELASFKKTVLESLTAEIKNISGELAKINSGPAAGELSVQQSAKAIAQSLRSLVEKLSK